MTTENITEAPPDGALPAPAKRVWTHIDALEANPFQPRSTFDPHHVDNIAASIKQFGLLAAPVVREHPDKPNVYQLIAGENRKRALALLVTRGEHSGHIEVEVREADDRAMLEIALAENLQRNDLDALEKAWGFAQLEQMGLTQTEIGSRYGYTQSAVSNFVRLLKLPDTAKELIRAGELSAGHGMALLMLKTPQDQITWSEKAGAYSVKALEREVRAFLDAEEDRMNPPLLDPPKIPKPREPKPSEKYVPPVVEEPELDEPDAESEPESEDKAEETAPVVAPPPAGGFVMAPVPASETAFLKTKGLSTATALVFVRRLFELCESAPDLSRILEADGLGGVLDHLQSLHGGN